MEKYAIARLVSNGNEYYSQGFPTNIAAADGSFLRLVSTGTKSEMKSMNTGKLADAHVVRVVNILGANDGECRWKTLN